MAQSQEYSGIRRFVLVIDGHSADCARYCEWLESELGRGALVIGINSLKDARTTLETCRPDCIVLDHQLLNDEGLDYMKHLAGYYGKMPPIVLFISGMAEEDTGARAISSGPMVFIPRNKVNASLLNLAVRRILQEEGALRA